MPKISINVSDYMYWKLLGSGENVSYIVQLALRDYWRESRKEKKE
ncbi:Uncharacterised protein [uncultured archaeon]|nr:Uncharacterised protein [uncultured archaeon]